MADVASTLPSWSVTRSSNNPQGGTVLGAGLDDNLREMQGVTRAWLASKGADIASATTTDLGAVEGLFHDITGTTTITSFGTIDAGIWKILQFDGVLTLTHNASSLILPGGVNITTAAGDMLMATSEGSGNWRVNWYVKATGIPVIDTTAAARKVLNINSHWLIDQIGEGGLYASVNGSSIAGPDGWMLESVGAGVYKIRTLADPDNAAMKVLEITCTTADAAIAAGDYYVISTNIEGYDMADLKAGTASADYITIQFTSDFSVTGTYGIAIRNSALDRSYVGTFTQTVANARETQTVTLLLDTSGTWLYTNGVGMFLSIVLAAGSTYQTTSGAWGAGNFVTTSAQANFMSANTNIGYLGPIQVIPGRVALAFGPQDIQKELNRCQRYFSKTFPQGTAVAQAAGIAGSFMTFAHVNTINFGGEWQFPVVMRGTPSITTYNPDVANANWRDESNGVDKTVTVNEVSSRKVSLTGGNGTSQARNNIHISANSRLT